jgi:hypothetical protein
MAAVVAFHNALYVLGFSAPDVIYIMGTEDINNTEELKILGDVNIHHLCES